MRFFSTILAGAAIVAGVLAQKPTIDTYPPSIKAGESVEITYSPATATATFVLRKGTPGNLDTLDTLTKSATGGKFTWSVPKDLANAKDYALQIIVNGEDNYTGLIAVSGGSDETSSSASASASASSTKSGSSTSSASASHSHSATITSSSVSGTLTPSAGLNSTVSTPTLSTSVRSTLSPSNSGSATTTAAGPPESTGAASALGSSPLALIFGAVAAMAYLN